MRKIFTLILLGPLFSFAQQFALSTSNSTYDTLTGATLYSGSMPWDDPGDDLDPLELNPPFRMGVRSYRYLKIEDGYVLLVDTPSGYNEYFVLDALFTNIVDRGKGTIVPESPIRYTLSGTKGNRMLTIEWRNFGFYGEWFHRNTTTDHANLQIILNEKMQEVSAHYGSSLIQFPGLSFAGYPGISVYVGEGDMMGTFYGTVLAGNPANPTTHGLEIDTFLQGFPAAGTKYTFKIGEELARTKNINDASNSFVLFPNPGNDRIWIQGPNHFIGNIKFTLMNGLGQNLKEAVIEMNQSIDVSQIPSGIYFIQIETEQGTVQKSWIKR